MRGDNRMYKGGLCKTVLPFRVHTYQTGIPKWICNQVQLPTAM